MRYFIFFFSVTLALASPSFATSITYGGYTGLQYRGNIYRERNNTIGDATTILSPSFTMNSTLAEQPVTLKGTLEAGHFLAENDNDYVDVDISATTRYKIGNASFIDMRGIWRYEHTDVGGFSTDITNNFRRAATPTPYTYGEAGAIYETPFNNVWLARAGVTSLYFNYGNVDDLQSNRIIQDDRDRFEVSGTGLLGYHTQENVMPFVAIDVNTRRYDKRVDATALYERDSSGGGIFVGAEYNDAKKDDAWVQGRAGLLHQDYNNPFLPDVDTLGFNANAGYRITPVTTLKATTARIIAESTFFGGSSVVQTMADISLAHILATEWNVDGKLRTTVNDLQVNPASGRGKRQDALYEAITGITYNVANPIYIRGEYGYVNRASDDERAVFHDNIFMLSAGIKY